MRPRGMTALAILEILLGLFALLGGVLHVFLRQGGFIVPGAGPSLSAVANVFGDSLLVQGLILLFIGYGILKGKGWGWSAALLFNILGLITSVAAIAFGSYVPVAALLANIVALYYLSKHSVKLYFRRSFEST